MTDDDDAYWAELRQIARASDPELALAAHLDRRRRALYRWYPYGESWRASDAYAAAVAEFAEQVVAVLAAEIAGAGD